MSEIILPNISAMVLIIFIGLIIDEYIHGITGLSGKGDDVELIKEMNTALFVPPEERKPNKYLGFGERVLFFVAFSSAQPLVVGAWLAFKLTSKWQTWSSVIKMPEDLNLKGRKKKDPLKEFEIRNRYGTNLLQRWLIGTLSNLLLGYGASGVAKIIQSLLVDFFPDPFLILLIFIF